MIDDEQLRELAERLTGVPGVAGVLLGGNRARGEHTGFRRRPRSVLPAPSGRRRPWGLGPRRRWRRRPGDGTGEWRPWVDDGGWLRIAGTAVDWLYRDLDRVHTSWADARAGRYRFHAQVGHPLGVPDFAYAGEVALDIILADRPASSPDCSRRRASTHLGSERP